MDNHLLKTQVNRLCGIDCIRALAIVNVIAAHFFTFNTPFHQTDFDCSLSMFLQGMGKSISGVSLFMMMTGFLNSKKVKFDKQYIRGLVKVLLTYVFFCVVTFLFKLYVLQMTLSPVSLVKGILDFTMIPYAWYIEMWIGLYLITPFLNLGYNAIPEKRMKQTLLVVLYLLTAVPNFTNRYNQHLMPGFWMDIYPVMFFMVGRYIKEYEPIVKWWKLVLVILSFYMINPLFSSLFIKGRPMMMVAGDPWGVFGTIVAVCIFLLLYKIDIRQKVLKWCVTKVALLSLDIFLCCYMVDRLVYPFFMNRFFESQQQFGKWFFVVVFVIVFLSAIIAQLKVWLFKATRLDRI
ncbi:MAG: acyltransferase [Bacteroidales bacterium]|nr:acyltransferase [Bacteroidales bacterium]